MTQQELIQEFRSYPTSVKSVVIRKCLEIFEKDLEEIEAKKISDDKRKLSYERLRGIAKTDNHR